MTTTVAAEPPRGTITIDRIPEIKDPTAPAWSPDGKSIAFLWDAAGKQDFFTVRDRHRGASADRHYCNVECCEAVKRERQLVGRWDEKGEPIGALLVGYGRSADADHGGTGDGYIYSWQCQTGIVKRPSSQRPRLSRPVPQRTTAT